MNKKIFFCIAIAFLLGSISYAISFPFSGTITTGKDIKINNDIFKFTYDPQSDKAFVQTPDTNLIIANGNCKGNDYYWVCIKSANFSYKNVTTFVNHYIMNVEIEWLVNSSHINQPDEPFQVPAAEQINASTSEKNAAAANVTATQPASQTANETAAVQAQNQQTESQNSNISKEAAQPTNLNSKPSNKKALFATIIAFAAIFLIGLALYKIKSRKKTDEQIHISDVNLNETKKK